MSRYPEEMLQPIAPESPCGAHLEYDPEFLEMLRIAQGKPESEWGSTLVPAEKPDWRQLRETSEHLLSRTKDLRVAVQLTRSLLNSEGFVGLRDGLTVVRGLLERYWNAVHPPLDGEDATMRVNVLQDLTGEVFLRELREAPLVHSLTLGRFSLKDVQVATGQVPPPAQNGGDLPNQATIEAAFKSSDPEVMQATRSAVEESIVAVTAIDAILGQQVGNGAPSLADLARVLQSVRKALPEAARPDERAAASLDDGSWARTDGADGAPANPVSGPIRSREDVVRALDAICEYFEKNEPSSPIPSMLQRAKKLVSKNFMEIIRDLAPEGVKQAETILGRDQGSPS